MDLQDRAEYIEWIGYRQWIYGAEMMNGLAVWDLIV